MASSISQLLAPTKPDAQIETEDIEADTTEMINITGKGATSIRKSIHFAEPSIVYADVLPGKVKEAKKKYREALMGDMPAINYFIKSMQNNVDREVVKEVMLQEILSNMSLQADWSQIELIIIAMKELLTMTTKDNGSTILHIAVGIGHHTLVYNLLRSYIDSEQVLIKRSSDGSTALHIAAIVGNKYAADLLVKKNRKLLLIQDKEGKQPLQKACEKMHLDITTYLLKAIIDDDKSFPAHAFIGVEIGALLTNAISAKHYSLATELIKNFPEYTSKNDQVLMAIAKTFPKELNYAESFVYPSLGLGIISVEIFSVAFILLMRLAFFPKEVCDQFHNVRQRKVTVRICNVLWTGPVMLIWVVELIILFLVIAYFLLLLSYYLFWKAVKILAVPPITHIENKKKEWEDAEKILVMVCNEIDNPGLYTRPILEAARVNAYKVVEEILFRSREASQSRNEQDYDIFQISIMNRSEKIYGLMRDIGDDHINIHRTHVDAYNNNILHFAAGLAPSFEFNHRTGAALQLQQELQWFEEVKKLVFPTYITQENNFKETPAVVFTREHQNLLKEGEQWMKTTAESCSITAALITTIVFAAAITVPGGSTQEKGTPLFRGETTFTIFAIADAISFFASSTALLVFLSILTARFAENDFRASLPRRLLIGLFTLLLSTISMMVAFGATLFLVFCDKKSWTLAPICGLAFIPVAFFVTLQFPLMVDLIKSTQRFAYVMQRRSLLDVLLKVTNLMEDWLWRRWVST